uniref:Ribosomal protein S19 n=1 Tax=Monomastix sp. (strain OKE-1) TaxID=141716 RepID=U5YER2_MONSK|nr:ribosomal protein S19 [Monomastix sp. OKE-1]AGZ90202.1 ribosomal protein S19 [Monomastix sp. OKE-1]
MTRSLWKGPFIDTFFIRSLRKVSKNLSAVGLEAKPQRVVTGSKTSVNASTLTKKSSEKITGHFQKMWSRRSVILPQFLDSQYEIYNGKQFIKLRVTEDMVGHKFGEFALTRKKPKHPTLKKNLITKKK